MFNIEGVLIPLFKFVVMKTAKKEKQSYRLAVYLRFWGRPSLPGYLEDKGGTFNLDLYLRYLKAVTNENRS